jgi:hypothetical protein
MSDQLWPLHLSPAEAKLACAALRAIAEQHRTRLRAIEHRTGPEFFGERLRLKDYIREHLFLALRFDAIVDKGVKVP